MPQRAERKRIRQKTFGVVDGTYFRNRHFFFGVGRKEVNKSGCIPEGLFRRIGNSAAVNNIEHLTAEGDVGGLVAHQIVELRIVSADVGLLRYEPRKTFFLLPCNVRVQVKIGRMLGIDTFYFGTNLFVRIQHLEIKRRVQASVTPGLPFLKPVRKNFVAGHQYRKDSGAEACQQPVAARRPVCLLR